MVFWQDKETTTLRDTTVVAEVLSRFDPAFAREADAVDWLAAQTAGNSDYLSRQIATLSVLDDASVTVQRDALLALQNADGSWGIGSGFDGNPLDTALAVLALLDQEAVASGVITAATDYLMTNQNTDGGWGNSVDSPSRTSTTTTILQAFKKSTTR